MRRFTGTHTIKVAHAPERALWFFTPEGERPWAGQDWDPQYPAGPPTRDGADPGTVWTTGNQTIWVTVDRDDRRVRYARVTPGVWAGTVEVVLRALPDGMTEAAVSYDLTALTAQGAEQLAQFAASFDAEIAEWEGLIRGAATSGP